MPNELLVFIFAVLLVICIFSIKGYVRWYKEIPLAIIGILMLLILLIKVAICIIDKMTLKGGL